jgi:isoleucyl-tRNA synthetase
LAVWKPAGLALSAEDEGLWKKLFELRERILPELEKERQAKNIGKALDAKVIIDGIVKDFPGWADIDEDVLRELLNVSQVVANQRKDAPGFSIQVAKADGAKCERCWHWETDVGKNTEHPTICGRCVEAVKQFRS